MAHRFRYKEEPKAAFVELAPDHTATPEHLFQWLNECEDVDRVEWQTTKTSQGNIGKHHSQSKIKVFPKTVCAGSATQTYLEFETTRFDHMSEKAPCPYMVTVMFKDTPRDLVPQAWSILRAVTHGKELFPNVVDD